MAAVSVPDYKAPALLERGWLKVNGHRAVVIESLGAEVDRIALRILFDEPYPYPHP